MGWDRFVSEEDRIVWRQAEKDCYEREVLARLELCGPQDTTPEAECLWRDLMERHSKAVWDVLDNPPVGKPYPPIETHITVDEAKVLGVPLEANLTIFGHPLIIDFEPRP